MMRAGGKYIFLCGALTAGLALLSSTALAQGDDSGKGAVAYVSRVTQTTPAPNTEQRRTDKEKSPEKKKGNKAACKDAVPAADDSPFSISIDGEPQGAGSAPNSADVTRCTDAALADDDIQVRFDGLKAEPALNVTVYPEGAVRGEVETFTPYSNYAAFIDHAEVRIFKFGASTQKEPLAVIPVKRLDGSAGWKAPENLDGAPLAYVLRVYGKHGNFDETTPKKLDVLDARRPAEKPDTKTREELIGYGENHLGMQNIPLHGGMISVNGANVPPGRSVTVMGQKVPVDANGKFATRQILPPGDQLVEIETGTKDGGHRSYTRDVNIPKNDWFYVGIADLTLGRNYVSGPEALVTQENSHRTGGDYYAAGRLAYYFKGKVKDDWQLTSSADTQEYELEDLFSNFGRKDPQSLLKRLDAKNYYPVYGDDSTAVEDAPTEGRFYVKAQRKGAQVMWGNFQTKITGTDLMDYRRSLYGGDARFDSQKTTTYGEHKTEAEVFAADPGTLDSIEQFRGTGGSLYYLHNQDVVTGSERLRIEVRDQNSGIVLSTKTLTYGEDYDINYIQGRVVLTQPLSSTSDSSSLVQQGTTTGNQVFLVASYEYTPSVTAIDNFTKGGRVSHWFGDHLRLGATGYSQKGSSVGQSIGGGDVILRYKPGTYLKMEAAKSDGKGTGALSSQNGGFDFGAVPQTTTPNINAHAYRAETAIDFAELTDGRRQGRLTSYWMKRENGYSAPGELTNEGVQQAGSKLTLPVTQDLSLYGTADYKDGALSGKTVSAEAGGSYQIIPTTALSLGLRHDDRDTALAAGSSAILAETGQRTDMLAKLTYAPRADGDMAGRYKVYGLTQGTLERADTREPNNRYGGGAEYRINDRMTLNGEVTGGNEGWGGKAGLDYSVSDRKSMYINYVADTERTDQGFAGRSNSIATGTKTRYSDTLSTYSENRFLFAQAGPSGIVHAYGLDLAPNDRWTWGAKLEDGTTSDPSTGDLKRDAASLSAGYNHDKVKYGGTLEFRHEKGNTTGERNSWLTKNTLAYQTTPDWRFLGGAEIGISNGSGGITTDANYTELSAGFAYRPVKNDRFNGLFKYSYLSDLSSPGQVAAGVANPYEQRSHVLNMDGIYDVTPKVSVGGKFAYRLGQLRDTSIPGSPWFDSAAWLGIFRTDLHIVNEWDAHGEIRYLSAEAAKDGKAGVLLGVYRHVTDNVKFGVGYNFTDYSDDITNLNYTSRGFFVNLVGSM
ncbi:MAG: OmpA family protein [Alphaproteobacteria bacterium]|nr:OmpA family protein [Alphaproteobacteria bacterium]